MTEVVTLQPATWETWTAFLDPGSSSSCCSIWSSDPAYRSSLFFFFFSLSSIQIHSMEMVPFPDRLTQETFIQPGDLTCFLANHYRWNTASWTQRPQADIQWVLTMTIQNAHSSRHPLWVAGSRALTTLQSHTCTTTCLCVCRVCYWAWRSLTFLSCTWCGLWIEGCITTIRTHRAVESSSLSLLIRTPMLMGRPCSHMAQGSTRSEFPDEQGGRTIHTQLLCSSFEGKLLRE